MNLSILVSRTYRQVSPQPQFRRLFFRILPICAILISVSTFGQRSCIIKEDLVNNPLMTESGIAAPMPEVIIIPVVIHVLYNTPEQNISKDQIRSQMAVLNQDFRKKNADAAFIPAAFRDLAGDSRIEFRLATIDPSGLSTDGIIRKPTSVTGFGIDDKIKSSLTGGDDAWDRNHYLNIWVGNITGGVMGYASTPGCDASKDGVVIRYTAFGTTANVSAPFNKGRTAVHEIGHWLGLRHIWGDTACGDDRIEDTPPQEGPTRGCPSGVVATCSSGASGNMYMNFMDFTNDECTNMFTRGQAARMRELFAAGGARSAMLHSGRAAGADDDYSVSSQSSTNKFNLYPNPARSFIQVYTGEEWPAGRQLSIYNLAGQVVKSINVNSQNARIDLTQLKAGMYYLSAGDGKVMKFVKSDE